LASLCAITAERPLDWQARRKMAAHATKFKRRATAATW